MEGIARGIEPLQKLDLFFGDLSKYLERFNNEKEVPLSKGDIDVIMGEDYDSLLAKIATGRPNIFVVTIKQDVDNAVYNYNVISAISSLTLGGEFYQSMSLINLFERKIQMVILSEKLASEAGYYGALIDETEEEN
jgi:hypothetical protein